MDRHFKSPFAHPNPRPNLRRVVTPELDAREEPAVPLVDREAELERAWRRGALTILIAVALILAFAFSIGPG